MVSFWNGWYTVSSTSWIVFTAAQLSILLAVMNLSFWKLHPPYCFEQGEILEVSWIGVWLQGQGLESNISTWYEMFQGHFVRYERGKKVLYLRLLCKVSPIVVCIVCRNIEGYGFQVESVRPLRCKQRNQWKTMHHYMVCRWPQDFSQKL